MKRVVFGYDGGFPLEQETLIQIQAAYEEDMLEALFTLWGLSTKERYKINIPESSSDEDGWLIMPKEILLRGIGKEDSSSDSDNDSEENDDVKVTKLQLIRVSYFTGGQSVLIEDKRLYDGKLPYSEGTINKVYEEFVGKLVADNTQNSLKLSTFKPLTSISEIDEKADNNTAQISEIKEDYLPRDGSKPMTGDLDLGSDNDLIFKKVNSSSVDYISYEDSNLTGKPNIPSPGVFDFVANQAKGEKGNAWIRSGGVITNKLGVGVTQPSKSVEINANNDSIKLDNLAEVNSQTPLVIDSQGNVGKNTNGITSANFIPGMIMMWSGNPTNVPAGWVLCDGNNSTKINGLTIPDLRGRFVAGYSPATSDYAMGVKKGNDTYTLTEDNIPEHSHTLEDIGSAKDSQSTHNPGSWEASGRDVRRHNYDTSKWGATSPTPIDLRPRYYVLAFIIFVGDYTPVIKPTANIKFDDEGISETAKNFTVDDATTVTIRIDGSDSEDLDGSVSDFVWEHRFLVGTTVVQNWTRVSSNPSIPSLLTFVIPGITGSRRYGTHEFRLMVVDNQGNESTYSRVLKANIRRELDPSDLTLSTDRIVFTGFNVEGVQTIQVSGNPGWKIRSKDSFITVFPSSSNSNLSTPVNLSISPSPSSQNRGTVVFETSDGGSSATLNWSAIIEIGIGDELIDDVPCFDLESDILMASGQSKKLKNIVIGDELRTFKFVNPLSSTNGETSLVTDLMKGAQKEVSKVIEFGVQTVAEYRKITLVNGKVINVTPTHPILASRDNKEVAWLLPDDLRGGYFIVNDNGDLVEIESKRTVKSSLEIGVLQLESGDNYFVNDIMVHNASILRTIARTSNDINSSVIGEDVIVDQK
ncbi:hypothetical protein [Tenacibaculum sp. 190524A05c]|uniref:hypothetical protein n=1 Tax=Tenacibaculum platacis TaxID=3137852 RepID=UPI0032B145A4